LRPAVLGALPRSLYLETTNRCDSKCQTCIRTFETLEPLADLTLERVRMIAEQFPALDRVVLHGIGPLLNTQIFDIIAYLKTRVAVVLFNSDAIGLTPARAFCSSRADSTSIACRWTRRPRRSSESSATSIASSA
jgi:molybdenum cofactor biosynthesis enzyme MoaA